MNVVRRTFLPIFLIVVFSAFISQTRGAEVVTLNPGDTIQAAIDAHPSGTTYLLNPGIYRMQSISPKAGDVIDGQNGAVLNGSRLLTAWVPGGTSWKITGQTQQGPVYNPNECQVGYPRCANPEDVYIDDVPMLHVDSLAAVAPGKWYFDYTADTIYIGDDPAGHKVETSVTRQAIVSTAPNVSIKNSTIEKYASPLQFGAISSGSGWIIQNNLVRLNHGVGVKFGEGTQLLHNKILKNGMAGYSASGVNNWLIEGNEIGENNYAGVNFYWEGGGGKTTVASSGTIRGNCVYNNDGPGIWSDIGANNIVIEDNKVFGNSDNGIMYEVSSGGVIRNNVVANNGAKGYILNHGWFWSPQILISTTDDTKVYGNTIDVPSTANAITIVNQGRAPYAPASGNTFYNNIVTERSTVAGIIGAVTDAGNESILYSTNIFHDNTYHLASLSKAYWFWNSAAKSFSQMQALGQEASSTADTTLPAPPTLNCAFLATTPTPPPPLPPSPTPPSYTPGSVSLKIVTQVVNTGGGVATPSSFTAHLKKAGAEVGGSPAAGAAAPGTFYPLTPGVYVLSQDANPLYSTSYGGYCNASGVATLTAGNNKTCTITNTFIPSAVPATIAVGASVNTSGVPITVTISSPGYVSQSFTLAGGATSTLKDFSLLNTNGVNLFDVGIGFQFTWSLPKWVVWVAATLTTALVVLLLSYARTWYYRRHKS